MSEPELLTYEEFEKIWYSEEPEFAKNLNHWKLESVVAAAQRAKDIKHEAEAVKQARSEAFKLIESKFGRNKRSGDGGINYWIHSEDWEDLKAGKEPGK